MGEMQSVSWQVTLEIRNLDPLTQEEEVQHGILRGMKFPAIVTDHEEANRLEKLEQVKIDLTGCPIKKSYTFNSSFGLHLINFILFQNCLFSALVMAQFEKNEPAWSGREIAES